MLTLLVWLKAASNPAIFVEYFLAIPSGLGRERLAGFLRSGFGLLNPFFGGRGPILAIIKAKDFDHALEIVNDNIYGLTGSIYTKNRDKIKKGKDVFHAGNLYINRKCTGALVGAHPFGGFNMSGTDSKAGGGDYLFLFTQPKSISEVVE